MYARSATGTGGATWIRVPVTMMDDGIVEPMRLVCGSKYPYIYLEKNFILHVKVAGTSQTNAVQVYFSPIHTRKNHHRQTLQCLI